MNKIEGCSQRAGWNPLLCKTLFNLLSSEIKKGLNLDKLDSQK